MTKSSTTVILATVLVATSLLGLSTLTSSLTKNAQAVIESYSQDNIPKNCEESFLPKSEGGVISENILPQLNTYLSQNSVAVGDEPLTNVKNVQGLCVLINLMETENPEAKQGNAEQIRNILNAALQEKSNSTTIDGIINSLLDLGLIQPSDD